ncbi:hypothetical protein M1349_01160 [Patescibacteria group bacterium]|nr:hypothetical protein [Patescibacteria group bacterium]
MSELIGKNLTLFTSSLVNNYLQLHVKKFFHSLDYKNKLGWLKKDKMKFSVLRESIYKSLLDLSTEEGIYASSKEEVFGCIFGRDSAITCLKILRLLETNLQNNSIGTIKLHGIVRNSLIKLTALQGKEVNKESGEEPGKFIHEYRKDKYERLINRPQPWYVYSDGILKNYDSIDSTPLTLIALYKYWQLTKDQEFLLTVLPSVEKGLAWINDYGDMDRDDLIEYELTSKRVHGGLKVQSWTDSVESLQRLNGSFPIYPIAPVEVEGYAWLALKLWADFYMTTDIEKSSKKFAKKLSQKAERMKKAFNKSFIFKDGKYFFPAQALDGEKNQIRTITGNPLLLLWASYTKGDQRECILDEKYIPHLVERSFKNDLFDKEAGIRTMSTTSPTFNPGSDSYHNGSFWPKLNGMIHEGLEKWGYNKKAKKLRKASLKPIVFFRTPIELYIKGGKGEYFPYRSEWGQESCRIQAWSAAAILDLLKYE